MTILTDLKPTKKNNLMDLVEAAGHNIEPWKRTKGLPASNPKFCYEWCFYDPDAGYIFNLWHEEMIVSETEIMASGNKRNMIEEARNPGLSKKVKLAASSRIKRAKKFDGYLKQIHKSGEPFRVIIQTGELKDIDVYESAKANKRVLDDAFWYLAEYNSNSGDYALIRRPSKTDTPNAQVSKNDNENILWIKTGWSDFYQGGPVLGNFSYLNNTQAKRVSEDQKEGHEKYNFLPTQAGKYCLYLPPQGRARSLPKDPKNRKWTVICLAKRPGETGIHIVGWLENAELHGRSHERPEYENDFFRLSNAGSKFTYSISSYEAYLIDPSHRNKPFSHTSIKTAKYSFLTRKEDRLNARKKVVLELLKSEIQRLKPVAIKNPTLENTKDFENDEVDPVSGYGTPEHRKAVENSSITFVTEHFQNKGFNVVSLEDQNCGYDLLATENKTVFELEVKGTSGTQERFFLTRNEHHFMLSGHENWRLAIVTNALTEHPNLRILDANEVLNAFSFEPLAFKCDPIES